MTDAAPVAARALVKRYGKLVAVDNVDLTVELAGFVEGPRFYPYLSGRRNLRLLADLDGDGAKSRIEEVLELVELRDRADDKVGGYSHGMRQRLGIASSLLSPSGRRAFPRTRSARSG